MPLINSAIFFSAFLILHVFMFIVLQQKNSFPDQISRNLYSYYLYISLFSSILIVAFVTRFLSYATETINGRMVQIDKSLEEAAWTAGATRMKGIQKILLPLAMPSLQSAYFLLFMAFFREIASAVLLYTASSSVLSTSIWSSFEQANWSLACALSLIGMIVIVMFMYGLMRLVRARPSLSA